MNLLLRFALFAYAAVSFTICTIQREEAPVEETCDWYIDPSTREFVEVER